MNRCLGTGPTQIGSSLGCACKKKTEFCCCPERLASETSCVASSATSSTRRPYRLSRGVLAETSASVPASPLSQASLRARMSRAINTYIVASASATPTAKATAGHAAMRQAAEFRRALRFPENITNASNGVDERALAVFINLLAQAIDLDINHIGGRINVHVPHLIKDHRASHDAPRISHQVFQKTEFLSRKLQELTTPAGLATDQVQLQIGHVQADSFLLRCGTATQKIPQPRHHFSQSKRLGQIVVAALFQTSDSFIDGTARREDQNGRGVTLRTTACDQIQPVHIWQAQINNEAVIRRIRGQGLG